MMAATLVIVLHFLTGDLFITSMGFEDEATCREEAQDIQVIVPPGTVVVEQCVISEGEDT